MPQRRKSYFLQSSTHLLCAGLFDRLAGALPRLEPALQIVQMLELQLRHLVTRSQTADARGTVNQVNLLLIKLPDFLFKLRPSDIKIHRPGKMPSGEFSRRPDIQDNIFLSNPQLLKFFDSNILSNNRTSGRLHGGGRFRFRRHD